MTDQEPVLALTPGEPSGIGPEILLKLKQQHPEFKLLAVADPGLLHEAAESLGFKTRITEWQPGETVSADQLACLPTALARQAKSGQPSTENVPYVLERSARPFTWCSTGMPLRWSPGRYTKG
jgi:4-hydroxythreonine-4-phosphate dehydrogenase